MGPIATLSLRSNINESNMEIIGRQARQRPQEPAAKEDNTLVSGPRTPGIAEDGSRNRARLPGTARAVQNWPQRHIGVGARRAPGP